MKRPPRLSIVAAFVSALAPAVAFADSGPKPVCIYFCKKKKVEPAPAIQDVALHRDEIRSTGVYVYNFLDFWDDSVGSRTVAGITNQIKTELAARGIRSFVVEGNDTPLPTKYTFTDSVVGYNASETTYRTSVYDSVRSNENNERLAGSRYRLMIFPSNLSEAGAWKVYEIKWFLYKVDDNSLVWSHTYAGKHLTLVKKDENSTKRAAKIIKDGLTALQSTGLIL